MEEKEIIRRVWELEKKNVIDHPSILWVSELPENGDVAQILFAAHFPFVAVPVEGSAKPTLLFGSYEYRGIEEIQEFIKLWTEIREEEEKNEEK